MGSVRDTAGQVSAFGRQGERFAISRRAAFMIALDRRFRGEPATEDPVPRIADLVVGR